MSQKIKVLMVDDEAQFRVTTERILTRRGFQTILAERGEEAVEKLDEHPDVVVLDISMPGMDGHDTLREIKRIKPDLPVIMLTGYGALPSAKEALTEGAFDYLVKPCDIDTLATKIIEAYKYKEKEEENSLAEKSVREVMIPIEEYTTLSQQSTIKEAIDKLRKSFSAKVSTSRIMETGHRSIVVFDDSGECIGVLAIIDLLRAIMPGYLSAPKPTTADSVQYSPMFWTGMLRREVMRLASKKIKEVMSPAPRTIDADANLMEAAYTMIYQNKRRLAVMDSGKVIGIIREQDLFFEIERILREV
jgi:CheY-like chemotaxis protein